MTKKERKKKKRIQLNNKKLIKMYPWLIPRNIWSGKIVKDYDYTFTELDCLGKGWKKAFGDILCRDIQEALIKIHGVQSYRLQQVKEKFGGLRWYDYPCYASVSNITSKYEHISEHICYGCGKPDVPITDSGWILPLCKECFEKQSWFKNSSKTYEDFVIDTNEIPVSYDINHYSKDKGDWIETINVEDIVNEIRRNWQKREHKRERDRVRRIRRSNG